MIKLTNVLVSTFPVTYNYLTWQIDLTQEDLTQYQLDFYRSGSQSKILSDYTLVVSGVNPYTDFSAKDYSISGLTNKFEEHYYLIKISQLNAPYSTRVQGPYMHMPIGPKDYVSREIHRRKAIVLNQYSSQEYLLLKRKTSGQTCPESYDDTLGRVTASKCLICYDTGWAGGFFSPIEFKAQINEGPSRSQIQVFGSWQDQDAIITTLDVPLMVPRDIIIDELNRRWEIITVRSINKALFAQEQSAQVRQIEKGDIIYSYPVTTNRTGFIYDSDLNRQ
jgi:hypothetical protein